MATGVKKPGLTDQSVATGVTKFRIASGGLKRKKHRYDIDNIDMNRQNIDMYPHEKKGNINITTSYSCGHSNFFPL